VQVIALLRLDSPRPALPLQQTLLALTAQMDWPPPCRLDSLPQAELPAARPVAWPEMTALPFLAPASQTGLFPKAK